MPITSNTFQYTRFTLSKKPLEVVPITLFPKPEANVYKCGNIIAVNAKFMCYVVKGKTRDFLIWTLALNTERQLCARD